MSTFFYGRLFCAAIACLVFLYADVIVAECRVSADEMRQAKPVSVVFVFDGDTVKLSDGRSVRLAGINTPEIGKDGKKDEPLSVMAKKHLQERLSRSGSVWLIEGQERLDRYGRTLGNLFDSRGNSLEASLVEEGLAFAIAIPPNLMLHDCLVEREVDARRKGMGIWAAKAHSFFLADNGKRTGFSLVSGRVERVYLKKGKAWWIDLDSGVALRVGKKYQHYFQQKTLKTFVGQLIEAKGWLVRRKLSQEQRKRGYKSLIMNIQHPDAIKN